MENDNREEIRWTEERLGSLDPPAAWEPDGPRALLRLRARRAWRRRAIGACCGAAGVIAACLALMALSAPQACATPASCAVHFWDEVFPNRAPQPPMAGQAASPAPAAAARPAPLRAPARIAPASQSAAASPAPRPSAPNATPPPQPTAPANFRESGSPSAPISVEIYSDYQCPYCAVFYRDTQTRLADDFVNTGKVRLVHRDFPLPRHRYARLAARFANAAGRLGYYDAAVRRIFETQAAWRENGDIAAQLTAILPPGVLQQVRQMVEQDASLDESVDADLALGAADAIRGTPSLLVVFQGKRQVFAASNYDLLKGYLNALLSQ